MSMLLAVLVTFGLLQRSNEITAIKATGISLYRILCRCWLPPPWSVESCSSLTSFTYPTATNGRTRSATSSRAVRHKLTCGPTASGSSGELNDLLLPVFDPDRDVFGSLSVFQFDPHTFQITHRVTAERAHWSKACRAGFMSRDGSAR